MNKEYSKPKISKSEKVYGVIYKITNLINGKIYIGQTTKDVKIRFRQHCSKLVTAISKAIKKHGKENFTIEIIDSSDNLNDLNTKECYWIKLLNSRLPIGYNADGGGTSKGPGNKYPRTITDDERNYKAECSRTARIYAPPFNKSKLKGTNYDKKLQRYKSSITINKKHIYLGNYKTEIEAAKAYDLAVMLYRNGEGYLNFPNDIDYNAFENKVEKIKIDKVNIKIYKKDPNKNRKSIYRGVSFEKRSQKFSVKFYKDKIFLVDKLLDCEITCAKIYDWFTIRYRPDNYTLNFPELKEYLQNLEDYKLLIKV